MFAPLLVQHSVTLTYPRQTGIRRRVNEVEDVLTKAFPTGYSFPQIVPVPEEIDPEVPRLLFGSSHGFNQILVSQIAVMLSVTYSPDWQETPERGVQYAKERLPVLHEVVGVVAPGVRPAFTGISTTLRIPSASNEASIRSVAGFFAGDVYEGEVNELAVRWSKNVRRDYFCNLNVQTVSQWPEVEGQPLSVTRIPLGSALATGVEVICDYNDRMAFNEQSDYSTSLAVGVELLDHGLAEAQAVARRLVSATGELK